MNYNDFMEKLYTIKEVAEMLRVSKPTVYRMMSDGKLKPLKLGKRTLFEESELNRFIEELKKQKEV